MVNEGQGAKINGLTRAAWAELGVTNLGGELKPSLSKKRLPPQQLPVDVQARLNDRELGVRHKSRLSRPKSEA